MKRSAPRQRVTALSSVPSLVKQTQGEMRRIARQLRRGGSRLHRLQGQLMAHFEAQELDTAFEQGEVSLPISLIRDTEIELHDRVAPLIAYLEASARATHEKPCQKPEPEQRILDQLQREP